MFNFLKKEQVGLREQLTFVGNECEIYIPKYYFSEANESLAEIIGEQCESIGLFWFKVDGKMYEMTFPIKIAFSFSEIINKNNLKLDPKVPALDYRIFKLKKGDIFVYNLAIEENVKNIALFINKIIEGGKLLPLISYNEAAEVFFNALVATGTNGKLGVSAVSYEFLLSQLFRNRKNLNEEFRFAYNGKNPNDARLVRITKVPELLSTFTSITGEDVNNQLINSVIRGRSKKTEKYSPLEQLIKF